MDSQTANILNRTTTAFYAAQAQSFSATRQAGWPGWARVLDLAAPEQTCRVLDVACGNRRFEKYLQQEFPQLEARYQGIDSCVELAGGEVERRDLVSEALAGSLDFGADEFDLTVCFGFFHHVPGQEARQTLLRALCSATRSGGLVAVSLWRFMESPELATKSLASHEKALKYFAEQGICLQLDANDYLLGWQTQAQNFRYCHHFDQAEIDALIASVAGAARLEDRYRADGRTGTLNEYLLLRVR